MSEYTFQRTDGWPEDLVLTELPSLEEIVENPEWWYNLTTNGGKTFFRDIYLGEAKQTMVLFHGGGVFEKFDPRYWGRGEGSSGVYGILQPEGLFSTSTSVAEAIAYCRFPLQQRCPANLYLILADRDLVVNARDTEIWFSYSDSEHIQIVDRKRIEPDDIKRVLVAAKRDTGIDRSLPRSTPSKSDIIDEGVDSIVDSILFTKELDTYNIPHESLRVKLRVQVLSLIDSEYTPSSCVIELSEIAESAIEQMLNELQTREDTEGELEYIKEYYLQFVEKGKWAQVMRTLFQVLSHNAVDLERALTLCVAAEYFFGVMVNLSILRKSRSLEHDPYAYPEDPLQIECLSPPALAGGFNRSQRKTGFVSLDYALNNPEVDVIFPRADTQELRCFYWNTAGMNQTLIRADLRNLQRRTTLLMRDFR